MKKLVVLAGAKLLLEGSVGASSHHGPGPYLHSA